MSGLDCVDESRGGPHAVGLLSELQNPSVRPIRAAVALQLDSCPRAMTDSVKNVPVGVGLRLDGRLVVSERERLVVLRGQTDHVREVLNSERLACAGAGEDRSVQRRRLDRETPVRRDLVGGIGLDVHRTS